MSENYVFGITTRARYSNVQRNSVYATTTTAVACARYRPVVIIINRSDARARYGPNAISRPGRRRGKIRNGFCSFSLFVTRPGDYKYRRIRRMRREHLCYYLVEVHQYYSARRRRPSATKIPSPFASKNAATRQRASGRKV